MLMSCMMHEVVPRTTSHRAHIRKSCAVKMTQLCGVSPALCVAGALWATNLFVSVSLPFLEMYVFLTNCPSFCCFPPISVQFLVTAPKNLEPLRGALEPWSWSIPHVTGLLVLCFFRAESQVTHHIPFLRPLFYFCLLRPKHPFPHDRVIETVAVLYRSFQALSTSVETRFLFALCLVGRYKEIMA